MKVIKVILSFMLAILLCLSCGRYKPADGIKKKVIKLSHSHQADFSSELQMAAWLFQQWVNDHSETLEVKIYASNTLGQERDIYEGMQLGGGASCAISGTAILNNFNKKIGVLDLPFLWGGYDHVHTVLDGEVGKTIAADLEKQGFIVLAWMDSWGFRNIVTADKDVKSPEELQGLKIRTIQTPIYIAALNSMGINATPMAFGEVYTSIQTGVLDGFEHNASTILANKYYEVSKYIVRTKHIFGPVTFIYSKAEWDDLTDDEKNVIREGARLAQDIERALAPIREAEAFEQLIKKGMKINDIDRDEFEKIAQNIQDKLAQECGATDLLKMIRESR